MILKKEKNHVINVANTIMFYKTLVSSNLVKQATILEIGISWARD
jgi:hypothetical protein